MSKFYAVAKGSVTGIFDDWNIVKKHVIGYSGSIYKSFTCKEDAINFLADYGVSIDISMYTPNNTPNNTPIDYIQTPINSNLELSDKITVYTDGSCSRSVGGIGGLFLCGNIIVYKFSEKIQEYPTTNIRAELMAILKALEIISDKFYGDINIMTDSEYSVNVFNKWIYTWMKNDWKTSSGKTPENLDLILGVKELLTSNIKLMWVRGHSDNIYNNMVDKLANDGRLKNSA